MKKRFFLLAALIWPLAHLAVFVYRFRRMPPLVELLYFVPTALLAAFAVHVLISRSRSPGQTTATVFGLVLFSPLALIGNVMGGVMGPLGVTVYGLVPLTAGATLGWLIGKRFPPTRVAG